MLASVSCESQQWQPTRRMSKRQPTYEWPFLVLLLLRSCDCSQGSRHRRSTAHTPRTTLTRHTTARIRYDTIRDAILTCARKPTWVSLIYSTEPTTKKCKNGKTKSREQTCSEITVNSPKNSCSEYLRKKKGRTAVGRICGKGRF